MLSSLFSLISKLEATVRRMSSILRDAERVPGLFLLELRTPRASAKITQCGLCGQNPKMHETNAPTETHHHVTPSAQQQPRGNEILTLTSWDQFRATSLKKAGNSAFLNMEIVYQKGNSCRRSFIISSLFKPPCIHPPSPRPPRLWEASQCRPLVIGVV